MEHVLFFHILGMSISIVYYNGNDSPQPFRFIADLGFFRVPAAAVPWHFWSSFLLLAFWPFGSFCFFGRVLIFYPCGKIVTIRHSFSYLLMTIMFLCAGDGCTSCCMYKYIYFFKKKLLAASKVRVRGWYGEAWDELFVNLGRLHPASVLGVGGEAVARASLHSVERRQQQLPPRRAGFALQRQVLRGVLRTRFGDFLVELSHTREVQLIV